MLTGYLYINFYNNTYTTAVCEVCAYVRGTGGRVCGGYLYLIRIRTYNVTCTDVVLMLFQEINKHSYGRLCVLLSRWRTLYSMTLVWKLSILTIVLGTQ